LTLAHKPLIESASPPVRQTLVRERIGALRGQLAQSNVNIDAAVGHVGRERVADVVCLETLRAELLFLDGREAEALARFRERILPLSPQLTYQDQFVVEQNLAELEFSVFSPDAGVDFYNLVDRRRVAGFQMLDAEDLLEAQNAASAGKHYEALPIIWRQLQRAYLLACWSSVKRATRMMANEALQLGSLDAAVYHGVLAGDKDLIGRVASALLNRRDPNLVRTSINSLIRTANLGRHFCTACEFLYLVADITPDEDLQPIAEWLLPRCAESVDRYLSRSVLELAWKALEPIAFRLPPAIAGRFIDVALAHGAWTTKLENPDAVTVGRDQIVKTVNGLVAAVTSDRLAQIAEESLPLAIERMQIHDYGEVINLLCHISQRGGPALKEQVRLKLFPKDKPLNRILMQVAPLFHKEMFSADAVSRMADQLAGEIRQQVQLIPEGETAVNIPETIATYNTILANGTHVVSIVAGVGVHAVAQYRTLLRSDALDRLIDAMLSMIGRRENLLDNRIALAQALEPFADVVTTETRRRVYLAMELIAKGVVDEAPGLPSASQAENPLNPFKFNTGTVGGLRAVALVTVAEYARFDSHMMGSVVPILEAAFYDDDPKVQRGAFAAAARLPEVSEAVLLAVLMGALNPDHSVATAAFFALAKQSTWKLGHSQWREFLHTLRLATRSPDVRLRRNAAAAARRWANRVASGEGAAALEATLEQFARDPCASVRELANRALDALGEQHTAPSPSTS
jgi:hypothetical protein